MKRLALVACLLLVACTRPPCTTISYHNDNALNLIVLPDGFTPTRQQELAQSFLTTVQQQAPFTSKPYFNAYLLANANTTVCHRYTPSQAYGGYAGLLPLQCDPMAIREMVKSCGIERGKIVIMTEEDVASQASISFDESGVMFLDMKNQPPEIIQHEFAHLFGLVDEKARMLSYAIGPGRDLAPNCVATEGDAIRRWAHLYPRNHTFPQGCAGHPDWYKPEDETLMINLPDPSLTYGRFNEWYLGKVMDCCYAANRSRYSCGEFFASYPQWERCRS